MLGRIFDIEEFAVYDGPGIRTVVFFKGCPLRCAWCHNPEGLDPFPTRVTNVRLCTDCGACESACPLHPGETCTGCGACKSACKNGLISIQGVPVEAQEVAARILKNKDILLMNGGGVTFSGGEPLMQPDFLLEIRDRVRPLHAAIETSGFADCATFSRVIQSLDFVIMDLKLIDGNKHKKYTSVGNEQILSNLKLLKHSGLPFQINIPLIGGVNDDMENMEATARLLEGAKALTRVCLLPYNKAAGAKYQSVRKVFSPCFDEARTPLVIKEPFLQRNMEVTLL